MPPSSRRSFVSRAASAFALVYSGLIEAESNRPMEPWSEGRLDIHHISTGRGNSVLAILPDGTSLMMDAGAVRGSTEALGPPRPDGSKRPGEWIGRYALRHLESTPRQELDYFVLSHFHGDHMGDISAISPLSKRGEYRLTGVTDVAELMPIRKLIDRGFPDYDFPERATYDGTLNYIKFARFAALHGTAVERFRVGSHSQMGLRHAPARYPSVTVQNLAANGEVWTGQGEETVTLFPPLNSLERDQLPTENSCSIALRISFGPFRYYIGGDLTCDDRFGTAPWMDVESAVARVAGPTTVAALDHHGYYDATCPTFVREMRSRIYIEQSWHATHPALSVLNEIYSPLLAGGPHDVIATGLVPAAALVDARLSDKMLSQHGHVVVRVGPGGVKYTIVVLDDSDERGLVLKEFGPFGS